ncbi:PREDICTED: uncharacterized protein LOC108568032 [Nicrophorus vespilloides]|uniref:Uncharacterized protein LOC108568032 n=1 Tax=Nicrophorus vespilloides TaxID=110193 RepID=A0ABM1NC19_NICVS|nr:PREDICTED: uncharacterized protein LOC108568032 [Nicrophorus vespilloides]
MDALLMFDVLMYINGFYFPLFALGHPLMTLAKFYSSNYVTPQWIVVDASVVIILIFGDLMKLLFYKKFREQRKVLAVVVAVLLTCLSLSCILYILLKQENVIKMEYIICSITLVLFSNELAFGLLQCLPCCKKIEYK